MQSICSDESWDGESHLVELYYFGDALLDETHPMECLLWRRLRVAFNLHAYAYCKDDIVKMTVTHRPGGSLSLVIVYVCEIARGGQELLQLRG